jgi:uncharacterized integral membrane protein
VVIFRVILILLAFVVVLVLALTNSQTMTNAVVFNRTYYDVPVAFVMLYSFSAPGSIARRKHRML